MDDMERYGDYTEFEEDGVPARRGLLVRVLKIALFTVLFATVLLLIARLMLAEYYPPQMKRLYVSEQMAELYDEGALEVVTQRLRFPYDDNDLDELNSNDLGTLFAKHLYVIRATDEVQITVRVNTAGLQQIAERYKRDMTTEQVLESLVFRLTDNEGRVYAQVDLKKTESLLMYHYVKLVFGSVELTDPTDGGEAPKWLRLETILEGETLPYSYLLIYENTETHHTFKPYTPSEKELTNDDQ